MLFLQTRPKCGQNSAPCTYMWLSWMLSYNGIQIYLYVIFSVLRMLYLVYAHTADNQFRNGPSPLAHLLARLPLHQLPSSLLFFRPYAWLTPNCKYIHLCTVYVAAVRQPWSWKYMRCAGMHCSIFTAHTSLHCRHSFGNTLINSACQ